MNCAEFAEQAAAYALDALEDDERLACEHHLREQGPHEGCEELVARYERTLGLLGESLPPADVPEGIWRAIESRVGARPVQARRPRATAMLGWAIAAVALLAALSMRRDHQQTLQRQTAAARTATEALTQQQSALAQANAARDECALLLERATQSGTLAREAVALLDDRATRIAPMASADARPFRATALYNPSRKRALAVSSSLSPVAGKDYELWVIAGSAPPQPAGFLRFDAHGVGVGEFDATLLANAAPSALAISLENAGGAPAPTDVILVAKL